MIVGEEKPDSGDLRLGDTVKLAYVDQSRDSLDGEVTFQVLAVEGDLDQAPDLAAVESPFRTIECRAERLQRRAKLGAVLDQHDLALEDRTRVFLFAAYPQRGEVVAHQRDRDHREQRQRGQPLSEPRLARLGDAGGRLICDSRS